jgi:hypothetical protein
MLRMGKYFIAIVIFLLINMPAVAQEVALKPVIVPAKIRGDGMLVDDEAMIIGIRNLEDPRATNYEFYYLGVDEEGNFTDDSIYKVYQDPNSTSPNFVQESLFPEVIDETAMLQKSANMENAILVEDDRVYFNGIRVQSGDVLTGGVMTLVDGKLYYQGQEINSGTVIYRGDVVR